MSNIITLAEAKEHLQVGATGENTKVQECIEAAETSVENWCGLYLRIPAEAVVEDFDGGEARFYLRYRPVGAITSVVNIDAGTTSAATSYRLYPDLGIIRAASDEDYSEAPLRWQVTYTAGYAALTDVPLDVRQMILGLTKAFFENRDDYSTENLGDYSYSQGTKFTDRLPAGLRMLMDRYRRRIV